MGLCTWVPLTQIQRSFSYQDTKGHKSARPCDVPRCLMDMRSEWFTKETTTLTMTTINQLTRRQEKNELTLTLITPNYHQLPPLITTNDKDPTQKTTIASDSCWQSTFWLWFVKLLLSTKSQFEKLDPVQIYMPFCWEIYLKRHPMDKSEGSSSSGHWALRGPMLHLIQISD